MFYEKDPRDSKVTDPNKYFAYTAPRTSPKTINYILKEDLENLKEGEIPQIDDFSCGGASYYINTDGRYGGCACTAHFLKAKEIQEYMYNDSDFIKKAIENNVTWFLPKEANEIFVF